jgi:hypothetical protein
VDKKNTRIAAIAIAVVACGLPGLCFAIFGGLSALFGLQGVDAEDARITGSLLFCVGLVGVLIPILMAFFYQRSKKRGYTPRFDEPIPPPN